MSMTLEGIFGQHAAGENTNESQSGEETLNKAQSAEATQIRILTHNIRFATQDPVNGEELWPIRRPHLDSTLIFNSTLPATFICLQEVLHNQLLDIHEDLNRCTPSDWAYIGVGRNNGKQGGEYSPIFYRPSIWKLSHWETVWLSETPKVPSKGWDAANIRIATVGQFYHNQTGKKVIITNTHFDHKGLESQKKSAQLLLDILEKAAGDSRAQATILTGDFNSTPTQEAYQIVTAPNSAMVDVRNLVPENRRCGHDLTFTGFSDGSSPSRIDFIFARKRDLGEHMKVDTYAVLSNRFDNGVCSSDHRACAADFRI
jgi:endonuclease/exonuclease/phosphatase family metal-dependent hydrolase